MNLLQDQPAMGIDQTTLEHLARQWEDLAPEAILAEAVRCFGDKLVLASAFGPESIILLDMLVKVWPRPQAFFLETGFHFPETLALKDRVLARFPQLQLEVVGPLMSVAQQNAIYGERLHDRNPDHCCAIRKVEPLNRALAPYKAWIAGMRREQSPTRGQIGVVQWDSRRGMVKFNPLATWTHKQVWAYIVERDLPYNPLHDEGFPSIGCSPLNCTAPVADGADPRSGRWRGKAKTECGLHA
ncbi:phosphoadenylyl-sulfate reductase [Gloeobacter violaceus]|uniref:Phosphoadenosine 5'-phosphosulfate reductase n=1 Tax=Gloeobacter violaceus (strain ATCC 29082 / PCC 7421) TaxID=251221 RepID=CYSH_GLOVI|nr:phosphoadenylyl-sulfate reductase [Gloeobacter violaceus]Q7NK24.1 RecName: Full=Phosphoadenosine 5'-phosphosulfate reductase; Short=PAPS reductase; AltName: Full=3'-phosphoadenylylsulfate reductase; AltName: Full=PAPS reductase, thioredoxin dependent; AltName: Full=PAPS sulfotransferase; AltName: Full=PAdoPS reductase [Gloeobacter violaceus PCC 7421]BAC89597.1 phosphoadenosine phosphosulfate [Gloeobacter violaceus PCC 7421]